MNIKEEARKKAQSILDMCEVVSIDSRLPDRSYTVKFRENEMVSPLTEREKPLLTIELQDEFSDPKVIYKGEEIKFKREIHFDWETDTDLMGGLTYVIEHCESSLGKEIKYPVTNRIERRVKGHA